MQRGQEQLKNESIPSPKSVLDKIWVCYLGLAVAWLWYREWNILQSKHPQNLARHGAFLHLQYSCSPCHTRDISFISKSHANTVGATSTGFLLVFSPTVASEWGKSSPCRWRPKRRDLELWRERGNPGQEHVLLLLRPKHMYKKLPNHLFIFQTGGPSAFCTCPSLMGHTLTETCPGGKLKASTAAEHPMLVHGTASSVNQQVPWSQFHSPSSMTSVGTGLLEVFPGKLAASLPVVPQQRQQGQSAPSLDVFHG